MRSAVNSRCSASNPGELGAVGGEEEIARAQPARAAAPPR